LGDTTFGECCVDEVAAQHLGADGVVHFGPACLTRTERLPVLYIYTDADPDVGALVKALGDLKAHHNDVDEVHVFYDLRHHKVP
jgi:diphthamide biosynthesis protein 2